MAPYLKPTTLMSNVKGKYLKDTLVRAINIVKKEDFKLLASGSSCTGPRNL